MSLFSVFSKCPVNVLSYFHTLKKKKTGSVKPKSGQNHCSLVEQFSLSDEL